MSTASQHCGTVCSACGGRLHAPSAPGVSGTTRGHYDPRARAKAGGQLGNPGHAPQGMWPKFTSEAEIAAPWSSGFSSSFSLFRPRRKARLRQSPPFFETWHPPPLEISHGTHGTQPAPQGLPRHVLPQASNLSCARPAKNLPQDALSR